ncbi:twin-arginine translocase subunit TatC [Brevibacillus dissolubilis]|uniref:twin-arginine translocase subunit TatC n=1 Tax=Brevibacillus dissolubilis TaxID=1844116 RepID=UPI0020FFF921|nr:twin-arginine translocase subunit TatC [Brevibacillus dissolubilis]
MKRNFKEMSVVEHLTELRQRLIWVLVVFVLACIGGFFVVGPLIQYLKNNSMIETDVNLISLSPADALQIYMQFAFLIGVVVTLPVILYHVWRFVSPGLKPKEKRVSLYFIPATVVLFVIGILFGFYVVYPMTLMFMANFSEAIGVPTSYGISQYFGFLFNMVVPFGFLFEMPIVVMFLTAIGIINPFRLQKVRRFAYFGLAIFAIVVTPADFASDIIVTIPLILLYEFSIWMSKIVFRKKAKEAENTDWETDDAEWDEEE